MVLFHLKIINDLYVIIITTTYSLIIDTLFYNIIKLFYMHETHAQIAQNNFKIFHETFKNV